MLTLSGHHTITPTDSFLTMTMNTVRLKPLPQVRSLSFRSAPREVHLVFVTRLRHLLGNRATTLLCWCFVLASVSAAPARAQDTLAQAKVLYAAASYEEALVMLDKLSASSDQDATAIAEYRIFCLLALGRSEDANRTIETVLRMNPFYKPSEAQVPPRIQALIKSARQKLLPGIVLASYADARAAFDRR